MSEVESEQAKKQSVELDRGVAADGELAALRAVLDHIIEEQTKAHGWRAVTSYDMAKDYYTGMIDAYQRALNILNRHLDTLSANVPLL